jgi:hypothetical protein
MLTEGSSSHKGHDKNFCSSNPESYKLIFELLGEIVDSLEFTDVCICNDEIHFDDLVTCPLCRSKNKKPSDWLIDVTCKTRDFLKSKGVTTWISGDNLDPEQNGKHLDITGPELLKNLPKDIVIMDWKYEGKFDNAKEYPSTKMFVENGFKTIGASWQTASNVSTIINSIYKSKALGYIGSSWNSTYPESIPTELVTAISLGAFLSWSPENCNLDEIGFVPSELYQEVAYNYGEKSSKTVSYLPIVVSQEKLYAGQKLFNLLGFPEGVEFDLKEYNIKTKNNMTLTPFNVEGKTAAIHIASNSPTITIDINSTVNEFIFLHCLNRQAYDLDMHGMLKEYKKSNCGKYIFNYEDGSTSEYVINFRRDINEWNERLLSPNTQKGIMAETNMLFLNIPILVIKNKYPDKKVISICIKGSNREEMNLFLFGLSISK